MDTVLHDLRYALRAFRKSPGFTLVAICTLALGIGATTAIFSVVNGVLLRPLPYAHPDRLVMLWNHWQGWPATWLSQPEYWDFSEQTHSFDGIAAFTSGTENLTGDGNPERVRAGLVTANAFPLLGVQPALGRVFVAEEDRPGSGVAVISDGLWRRRFGADPAIIGRSILLNDSSVTVLGVMPVGFQLPLDFTGQPMDLWRPLALNRDSAAVAGRGNHGLNAFARVKPGVTVAAANADVGVIATRMTERYPQQEIGLRVALGEQPGDVVRLVVRQGGRLAITGVGIGLVAAFALTRFMHGMLYQVGTTDPTTFTGIAALLAVVAMLATYIPARRAARVDPMVALRSE